MLSQHGKTGRGKRAALLASVATIICATSASAGPTGGNVIAGTATIDTGGGGAAIGVTQDSQSAIVEWSAFDLGAGETFYFNQPNANAVTLNRVLGTGASVIDGDLTANGNIFIMNSDGVLFGANATVDVNGLVATSLGIDDADFMAGDFDFQFLGEDDALIENQGDISIADSGILAFVAPNVSNTGQIAARLGTVTLAAGDRFVIDFFGDGLVTFSPDIESGSNTGGIDVTGAINAEGGAIYLTATDALEYIETIINVEADLVARGAAEVGGKIILTGTDSTTVTVDATLDASGGDGGEISITGRDITVAASAELLADGFTADFAGVLWTFQNAGFGGLDGGSTITGSYVYNAATDTFSNINVVTSVGASLPGATYTVRATGAGSGVADFFSTNAPDPTGEFRLRVGWNAPMTDAGGTLNVAFGFEAQCQTSACGFPGFGVGLARGLIGPTSVNGVPLPIAGSENGGTITVASTETTTFSGLASVEPGATIGTGGDITLSSDGVLVFDGVAQVGTAPRDGTLTLISPPPPPPPPPPPDPELPEDPPADDDDDDMMDEEEIDESVEVSISEIASTQTSTETTSGDESGAGGEGVGSSGSEGESGGSSGEPPTGSTVFEGETILESDADSLGGEEERQLMCLLGVAEAACAAN